MLARATARQKELAIRKALGAARGRVLRQLLTESALLAGRQRRHRARIAAACFGYLSRLLPGTLPASATLALDWRVLALTIAAALVTVLLFGAGPAFAAARRDFGAAFGRAVGAHGAKARRLRTTLVVAEIALTVVLLAGAGLLLRSYATVLAVDPGFDAEGLLVAETVLPESRYPDARGLRRVLPARARRSARVAGRRERGLHELRAARVQGRPIGRCSSTAARGPSRRRSCATSRRTAARARAISRRSAFRWSAAGSSTSATCAARARVGRHQRDHGARVLARRGCRSAERFSIGGGELHDRRRRRRRRSPDGIGRCPRMPRSSCRSIRSTAPFMRPRQLVVRTGGDPLALAPAVRNAIWAVDPTSRCRACAR